MKLLTHFLTIFLLSSIAWSASAFESPDFSQFRVSESASAEAKVERKLYVAGGCFWCVESDFEKIDGVKEVRSIYTGGTTKDPTYQEVSKESTGHYEAVEIVYDPTKVSVQELVHQFWFTIDPLDPIGQFCDKGDSYRSALFFQNEEERKVMEASLKLIQTHPSMKEQTIATKILPMSTPYLAEDYHQDYYKKNPIRYKVYRYRCGRDARLAALWGRGS